MTPLFVDPIVSLEPGCSGVRTLPDLIQFHLETNPDHLFCVQAAQSKPDSRIKLVDVTYRCLGEALRRCHMWLCCHLPEDAKSSCTRGTPKPPAVALFMESDVRLATFILTLMGMGIPIVLLSTRLSASGIRHLVQVTGARTAIVSTQLQATFAGALSAVSQEEEQNAAGVGTGNDLKVSVLVAEHYETLLATNMNVTASSLEGIISVDHFVREDDREVIILHSSGTSGLPKPIYCSHRHFLQYAQCHEFDSAEQRRGLTISTSPFFHGFGMFPICLSLGIGKPFCILPASSLPTGPSVTEAIVESQATSLLTVPSIVEEIALVPESRGIKALAGLHFIAFGGGMPKESVGQELGAAGVRLINHYGATETGPLSPLFVPEYGYDWHYIRLRRDTWSVMDLKLDKEDGPNVSEDTYKLSMRPLGWSERFELQDQLILRSGGTPKDLGSAEWSIAGRTDDLICLATGEKVRPTVLESSLRQCTGVKEVIAIGDGEFELVVLVEIETDHPGFADDKDIRQQLWAIVQQANLQMDSHARLTSPGSIIFVESRSLPRSDKGTILRREVSSKFGSQIAETYRQLEYENPAVFDIDTFSPTSSIRKIVDSTVEWRNPNLEWSNDDDFFALGMDSLQAVKLRRALLASLQVQKDDGPFLSAKKIDRDFVYRFPSVSSLAKALANEGSISEDESSRLNEQLIENFVKKYSNWATTLDPKNRKVVLLTGSTGSLGSYLAAHLAADPSVTKVVCLIRPSRHDSLERQKTAFKEHNISMTPEQWSKMVVIPASTDAHHLGLGEEEYQDLTSLPSPVTHVLHVAWPMNFNQHLSSYETSFKTLQNLVRLAMDLHAQNPSLRPRLLFSSSISTVGNYRSVPKEARDSTRLGNVEIGVTEALIPEIPVSSACVLDLGYARAKLVCEHMIQNAAKDHRQIEIGFVRTGQIAGSTDNGGYWNSSEHFAALVRSASLVGKFPRLQGTLSWLPVNVAADAMVEMIFSSEPLHTIYHLENPVRQSWDEMVGILTRELDLGVVSFSTWLDLVSKSSAQLNPAKDLLDFFMEEFEKMSCGQVVLDTSVSRSASPTLQRLKGITAQEVKQYLDYWRKIGLL